MDAWKGKIDGLLSIETGPIIGLTGKVNITDASIKELLEFANDTKTLTGKTNVIANLNTAGSSLRSWMYNLAGSIGVAATDVTVKRFNLTSAIRAASAARKVDDVLGIRKLLLGTGMTKFDSFFGKMFIQNGVASISDMSMNSKTAYNEIDGVIDILNGRLDIENDITLKRLVDEPTPRLLVTMTNDLKDFDINVNTDDLESYVARKNVQ
jgi:uncharacterized protein involved in outer membrane biogenesis